MPSSKGGIPDRWRNYKAVGKRLQGTRFVAFKVPLKKSFNQLLASSQIFGPQELLDTLWGDGHELGLIIDLTCTTRYYGPEDLPPWLKRVKIVTRGHVVPNKNVIVAFEKAVQQFLQDNADNDKLIGIHCTHGLNRTGYLVCRYLIDVDKMDPGEAINLFNTCRGHDIERKNYINNLLGKSDGDECRADGLAGGRRGGRSAGGRRGAQHSAGRSAGGRRGAGWQPQDRWQEDANWTSHSFAGGRRGAGRLAGGQRGAGRQPQDRWQEDANWTSHSSAGGRRGAGRFAGSQRGAGRFAGSQRGAGRQPQDRRQEDCNWFSHGGDERMPDGRAGGRRGAGWQPRERRQENAHGFSHTVQRQESSAWTQRGRSQYGFSSAGNTNQRPSQGQQSLRPQLGNQQAPARTHIRWTDDDDAEGRTEYKSCW
ncbi:uncharacterized protein LOC144091369 isoform X2 [Stigmatopora argus]